MKPKGNCELHGLPFLKKDGRYIVEKVGWEVAT